LYLRPLPPPSRVITKTLVSETSPFPVGRAPLRSELCVDPPFSPVFQLAVVFLPLKKTSNYRHNHSLSPVSGHLVPLGIPPPTIFSLLLHESPARLLRPLQKATSAVGVPGSFLAGPATRFDIFSYPCLLNLLRPTASALPLAIFPSFFPLQKDRQGEIFWSPRCPPAARLLPLPSFPPIFFLF